MKTENNPVTPGSTQGVGDTVKSAQKKKSAFKTTIIAVGIIGGTVLGIICALFVMNIVKSFFEPRRTPVLDYSAPTRPTRDIAVKPSPSPSPSSSPSSRTARRPSPTPSPSIVAVKTPRVKPTPRPKGNISLQQAEKYIKNGLAWYEYGNYSEAEKHLQQIVKKDPCFYEAYLLIGHCQEKRKKPEEAFSSYRVYFAAAERNPERLRRIGRILEEAGMYDYAGLLYSEAVGTDPNYRDFYALAGCCFLQEQYTEAIAYLKKSLELKKDHYPSLILIAESYRKNNRLGNALDAYKAAHKLKPKEVSLLYEMGVITYEIGDYRASKSYLKKYTSRASPSAKKNKAYFLLKEVTRKSMKAIPAHVESQSDSIPGIKVIKIRKIDNTYVAHIKRGSYAEELTRGQTLLNKYYILDINAERLVLKFSDSYLVLRPEP